MLEEDIGLLSSTTRSSFDNDGDKIDALHTRHMSRRLRVTHWIFHVLLFSTSVYFFFQSARERTDTTCPGNWFPIMGDFAPTKVIRFNGTFRRDSKFKGPPSKAVDEAWESIAPLSFMTIPESIFKSLNASKYATEAPSKASGDRLALFEAVHQIHCVKTLWKTAYPEYYTENARWARENPDEWLEHLDHCADMLRQKLMCDADASLITYNWIQNHYSPHPNFNVQHQCRDYNRLLHVARQYRLEEGVVEGGKDGHIIRPSDKEVVDFPEPPFDPLAEN